MGIKRGGRWQGGGIGMLLLAGLVLSACSQKQVTPYEQARAQREAAKAQAGSGQELPPPGQQPGRPSLTAPVAVRQPGSPAARLPFVLQPSLAFIEERRSRFDKIHTDWQALDRQLAGVPAAQVKRRGMEHCAGELRDLAARYRALAENLSGRSPMGVEELVDSEMFLETQRRDIRFLEGDCLPFLTAGVEQFNVRPGVSLALQEAEAGLQRAMQQGDYAAVVGSFASLPLPPNQRPSYASSLAHVQALIRLQRDGEALAALREMQRRHKDEGALQREFEVMRLLADMLLGQGKFVEAREQYREIVRQHEAMGTQAEWANKQLAVIGGGEPTGELRAYAALQRRLLGYNPERDGFRVVRQAEEFLQLYPHSAVTAHVDGVLQEQRRQAQRWFDDLLARADELATARQYREATVLLENVPGDMLPPPQQDMIRTKIEALALSEAVGAESARLSVEQESQESWNAALAHFEAGRYDESIAGFKKLLNTRYGERARSRIDEASRLGAQEDRRRAAELFIRARNTPAQDVENRKKLLLASRKLLQDIPAKYPQSDLRDKIESNLKRIEDEIRRIDPTLLGKPVSGAGLPEEALAPLPPQTEEGMNAFDRQ